MSQSVWDGMPDDFALEELIERLRKSPPRPGFPRKTFRELCDEQGVGPIDPERLKALALGPGEDDIESGVTFAARDGDV